MSAGTITSTDQAALSTALDSIDQSIASGGTSSSGSMKDRLDTLVDAQVDAGTLTEEQADELKAFFAQGPGGQAPPPPPSSDGEDSDSVSATDAMTSTQGPRGPRGPGGPPPPPPPLDEESEDSDTTLLDAATSTTSSTASSSSTSRAMRTASEQIDALEAILEKLRASLSSTNVTYGGTSEGKSGLLFDSQA